MPTGQFRADVAAPSRWVDEYGDSLYAFAHSRVGDPTVAEDLVQETFLAGLAEFGRFRRESSLLTWLTAILRRKIADEFRGRRRMPQQESVPHETSTSHTLFDQRGKWLQKIREWRSDPQEIAQSQEFWRIFETCIEQLPSTLAAAFRLKQLDGLKAEKVCSALQISSDNLSVRMHRARLSLRECLERNWFAKS